MKVKGYMGSVELADGAVTIRKRVTGTMVVPVGNIQAVSISNAGVGMKGIRFAVGGATLHGRQSMTGSHGKMAQDPYALTFRAGRVAEFEAFAAAVQAPVS